MALVSSVSVGMVVAGRYTLERCINRGGIGSLWHARDEQSDKYCGLRLAESTGQGIVELAARYLAEADVIGRIRCENVVDVLDYGEWNGMPFLVVEHVEGEELSATLLHQGYMQPKVAYRIMAQTARALARAHASGIVHGDLTPEHILITSDGMQPMAKVFNFGLSQRGAEADVTNSTRIGSFLHMPYYSSPEHIANRAVDWRSDLWSLAVICYECLVGRRPFESNNFGELLSLIVTEPIVPINLPGGRTPAALQSWWKKAMSRDPDDRYQSAKEMADALGKALGFPLVFVPEPMNSPLGLQALPAALPIVIRDSSVPLAPNPSGRAITPNPKLKSTPASASSRPMQVAVRSQLPNPDSNRSMAKFSRHATVIGLGAVSSTPPLPNESWSGSSQRALPPRPSGVATDSDAPESPPPSSLKVDVDVVPLSAGSHPQPGDSSPDSAGHEQACAAPVEVDNDYDSFGAFPLSEAPTVARKPIEVPLEEVYKETASGDPLTVSSVPQKTSYRAVWITAAGIVIAGVLGAARLLSTHARPAAGTDSVPSHATEVLPVASRIQLAAEQTRDAGLVPEADTSSADIHTASDSPTEVNLPSDSTPSHGGVAKAKDKQTTERNKPANGKTGGARAAPHIAAKASTNPEPATAPPEAAPPDTDSKGAPSKPANKAKPSVDREYGI